MALSPLKWWHERRGNFAPVGHVLRHHLNDRWNRFHSLPGSKRYPESEQEYVEIVRRHVTVANVLFVSDEPIFVYRSRLASDNGGMREKPELAMEVLLGEAARMRGDPAVPVDQYHQFDVRSLVTTWKPVFFENLVQEVADEMEHGISIVSPSSGNVYCPYDGGMDVFVFSLDPDLVRAQFNSWLSARDDFL